MLLLIVFMISYSISSLGMLQLKQTSAEVVYSIFGIPYWNTFGDLNIESLAGTFFVIQQLLYCHLLFILKSGIPFVRSRISTLIRQVTCHIFNNCVGVDRNCFFTNNTVGTDGKPCPRNLWLALIMLAIYMIITNVLLLNLLIAVFK